MSDKNTAATTAEETATAAPEKTAPKLHIMELLTNTINEHTRHDLVPVTHDPNGPWKAICNCDAPAIPADGYLSGERNHAEHVAEKVLEALQAYQLVATATPESAL